MSVPTSELQKLAPSALVELFELDATALGGSVFYFHAGTNELRLPVWWQAIEYQPYPILASGFERSGRGPLPQPKLRVADVTGDVTVLVLAYDDLVGAKVTRRRTFKKYLDAVNFTGGVNPTADPTAAFPDEIWYVNRKAEAVPGVYADFELASAADVAGVQLPRRQCIANVCPWIYRGPECGYAGGAVADENDVATSDINADQCSKSLTGCKLRFGTFAQLPFGGFPAAGLIR